MAEELKDNKKNKDKMSKRFDPSKIVDTEPTIEEAVKNTAVITFGRMNPMTVGHEKLVNAVAAEAKSRGGDPMVFLSHSSGAKSKSGKGAENKDPLVYDDKIRFAQKAFGPIVKKSPYKTLFEIMKSLNGKYKNVVMVAGSDRVPEYEALLKRYNGKEYNFDSIEVVSAGGRDPDAEGVSGMSGTKMRAFAKAGDAQSFTSGLPKNLKPIAQEVMDAVLKGIGGMKEELEERVISRQERRKRSIAMKRNRFKLRRAKIKAERKAANMEVLKKRARKAAIKMLKNKFAKNRKYDELSAGEKETIDKRIARVPSKRIEAIARKLIKKERELDIARRKSSSTNESVEINEASVTDTTMRQRPHMLLNKEGKVKFDGRFKMYKKKVNESTEDLLEEIEDLMEATEKYTGGYYKGVPKDKKDDRAAHFKRYAEKGDGEADKDSNYKPAPGDFEDGERVKTKLSKHTKKYRAMYGESFACCGQCNADPCICEELSEDATASLKKKAEKTGMPLGVLRKVYNRGVAAWKSGHRPGTTPEQWGHARVNSFVTKSSGTWGKADKDLAAQVREEVEIEERSTGEHLKGMISRLLSKTNYKAAVEYAKKTGKKAAEVARMYKGVDARELATMLGEEHGAGDWGTDKLRKRYAKDTPGQGSSK